MSQRGIAGTYMGGIDRRYFVVVGIIIAGAYILYKIFGGGKSSARSLTPDEMRAIIVNKYREYSGKYFLLKSWAEGVGGEEDDKLVEDLLTNYYYSIVKEEAEAVGEKLSEDKILERARSRAREEIESGDRHEILKKLVPMIGYPPSMLFIGPPGVGKSETVREAAEEIAREMGLEFVDYKGIEDLRRIEADPSRYFVYVDLRLTSLEPADITGIPRSVEGGVSEYVPFGWAKALSLAPGILNLEELTNVDRPDLLSAAYQLVLDHRAGFTKFHPGVMVVALGNPPEWSAVAVSLPAPLLNRFEVFNVVAPTPEEWIAYMYRKYGKAWFEPIGLFLKVAPRNMLPPPEAARSVGLGPKDQIPTPRSWSKLAVQLYRDFEEEGMTHKEIINRIAGVMRKIMNVYESCIAASAMLPGNKKYDEVVKRVCEEIRGTVGDEAAEELITVIGRVYQDPEVFMKSLEAFKKYWEELEREVISRAPEPEEKRKTICFTVASIISEYLDSLYKKAEEEGMKPNKYIMDMIDTLAKILDYFGNICDLAATSRAVSAICDRSDMEVKEKLYELSSFVRKAVEEYVEREIKGGGAK